MFISVTETAFTFPPFRKMDTVCNVTIFMTLNIRKQKKTRGTPTAQLTAASTFPGLSAGRGMQAVRGSFGSEEWSREPKEARGLMFLGKRREKETAAQERGLRVPGLSRVTFGPVCKETI